MQMRTRRMGAEAGQDLVEYALVLPLFLLLVLSVVEFGILFYQYSVVVNAAKEGARAGVVMDSSACDRACLTGRVNAAVTGMMTGVDPDKLKVKPDFLTCANGPCVRVKVTYKTSFATKLLIDAVGGNGDVTLESTATMQREY